MESRWGVPDDKTLAAIAEDPEISGRYSSSTSIEPPFQPSDYPHPVLRKPIPATPIVEAPSNYK